MARLRLGMYGAAHFLVDFSCAALLLGRICPDWNPGEAILLYNLFAFAAQMPIGLLADKCGRSHLFAAAGCLLAVLGWALPPGLMAALAAGLGNAAFHVGGGLHALNESGNRAGPLGLFVSPGAFGVYLGGILAASRASAEGLSGAFHASAAGISTAASSSALLSWAVCLALALFAALAWRFGRGAENAPLTLPRGTAGLWGAAACLLAVVILRSYLGLAADLPWKAESGVMAVCAVAGGKAAGGYLADKLGVRITALASLTMSAVCFLFGSHPAAGMAGLFLFNMTMPLTLWAAAGLFPGMKGFSFGLLTFGLFLGFLPVYFEWGSISTAALAFGTLLSLPPLILGIGRAQRERRHNDAV